MIDTENKGARLLDIYERLSHGEVISKKELAEIYGVTVKTIQRDIDELRAYLAEKSLQGDRGTIEYSPAKKGYRLIRSTYEHLNHKEILALAKILLESRALEPGELHTILDKLTATCIEKDRTTVEDIIQNETFYYVLFLLGGLQRGGKRISHHLPSGPYRGDGTYRKDISHPLCRPLQRW